MNLPNRLLLLLWAVFALPNASSTGPALRIVCSTPDPCAPFCERAVRWCSRKLVLSVLPEPLSPLITMHWLRFSFSML
uniref:Putative secreted protein n=1 Tax=Anopheles triannulatus TaxID=58253 RepID=A0A2M4B4T5_9DIPT